MKNLRIFSLIIVASVLLSALAVSVSAGQFTDVPEDSYYAEAVEWAYENGITTGVSQTRFAPDSTVTRGQAVTFLWRALDCPDSFSENKFKDVKKTDYFISSVCWAIKNNITTGTSAYKFSPEDECTYAHILTFIYRAMGEPDGIDGQRWYTNAVQYAEENGILEGTIDGELDINAPCPRKNIVTYLYRAAKLAEGKAEGDYKYVIIIGVDGGGAFFKDADTPNIDRIFADGAVSYNVVTSDPTISAQSWGSLLTGVTPEYHKLNNSNVSEKSYDRYSYFPTSFRIVRENMNFASLGSFVNWSPINGGIVEDGLSISKGYGNDAEVADLVCAYVESKDPTFVFVQFDNADHCGHTYGYGTKDHLDAITEIDALIAKIYAAYEEKGIIDDTLFIVTADHGGNGTDHGGLTDGEKYIMVAAAGKTVHKGVNEIEDMGIRDLASVVLYALGLSDKQPSTWTSRVPGGLFEGVEGSERPEPDLSAFAKSREHENEDTPALDDEKSAVKAITEALGEDSLLAYIPFDGTTDAAAGTFSTTNEGKFYYVEGYRGKGAMLNDGYVQIDGFEPNKKNFTVGFWMKTSKTSGDPIIFTNKDWENKVEWGFAVAQTEKGIQINLGQDKYEWNRTANFPEDYEDGWVYVIIVVNRLEKTIQVSFDFKPLQSYEIHKTYTSLIFNAKTFTIGQDASGDYEFSLPAVLDEFILVNGALTNDQIADLKYCYSK